MAKLDISTEALAEILPTLLQFCSVVGSAAPEHPNTVTLLIEGVAVPLVEKVTCTVTIRQDADGASLSAKFDPIQTTGRGGSNL